MPAPLAKGLLFSLSLLLAAGLAVYENPQVRQWVDESRRKVAIALRDLSDELAPPSEDRQEERPRDASTREDESPEAVERRRQARQAILERGRMLEARRRAKQEAKGRAKSFDDMVDKDGTLKPDTNEDDPTASTTASTTATETQEIGIADSTLRHRTPDTAAAIAQGTAFANPFDDETFLADRYADVPSFSPPSREEEPTLAPLSRSVTPTHPTSPPLPKKPDAYLPHRLLIDTASISSHHPSEQLLDLTPTTSASPTTFTVAEADMAELAGSQHPHENEWETEERASNGGTRTPVHDHTPSSFWSVNEWAMNHSAEKFYSPPASEAGAPPADADANALVSPSHPETAQVPTTPSTPPTVPAAEVYSSREQSLERVSRMGSESGDRADVISLFSGEGVSTPGSWSEVGSWVSEEN